MERLAIFFIITALLTACAMPLQEAESEHDWDFPKPDGLFVFYKGSSPGGVVRYGLVNALGEVAIPFEYYYIEILQPFDRSGHGGAYPAYQRFFRAIQQMDDPSEHPFSMALISPHGNFLTGFHYLDISHIPGSPTDVVARRIDRPGEFFLIDIYGDEHLVEDAELLNWLRGHYYWTLAGIPLSDVQQGFDWILETGYGNFWGAMIYPDEQQLIRLYTPDGDLVDDKTYHSIEQIDGGMFIALAGEGESFVVNYSGRRLAGPYDSFIHNPRALPFLLGIRGDNAYVLTNDYFRELHTIKIPQSRRIVLWGGGQQAFAEVDIKDDLPPTLIMLGSGEEIMLDWVWLAPQTLRTHNENLTRFVFTGSFEESSSDFLVGAQQDISATGDSFASLWDCIYEQHGLLVVTITDDDSHQLVGLIDWDGNILLPAEFTQLEVLPGNALRVEHDGVRGIMDLGGEWIYTYSPSN